MRPLASLTREAELDDNTLYTAESMEQVLQVLDADAYLRQRIDHCFVVGGATLYNAVLGEERYRQRVSHVYWAIISTVDEHTAHMHGDVVLNVTRDRLTTAPYLLLCRGHSAAILDSATRVWVQQSLYSAPAVMAGHTDNDDEEETSSMAATN